MQFSGLELSAIVKLAVAIAASDGNVAEQEKAAISLELLKFGVDENSVNTLVLGAQAIEYKDALTIVTLMNDTQKNAVKNGETCRLRPCKEIPDGGLCLWRPSRP
jgi:uncharacterized membrane protein YebE (DUF533 family)